MCGTKLKASNAGQALYHRAETLGGKGSVKVLTKAPFLQILLEVIFFSDIFIIAAVGLNFYHILLFFVCMCMSSSVP